MDLQFIRDAAKLDARRTLLRQQIANLKETSQNRRVSLRVHGLLTIETLDIYLRRAPELVDIILQVLREDLAAAEGKLHDMGVLVGDKEEPVLVL